MSPRTSKLFAAFLTSTVLSAPGLAQADRNAEHRGGGVQAAWAAGQAASHAALQQLDGLASQPALSEQARAALQELSVPSPVASVTDTAPPSLQIVKTGRADQREEQSDEAPPPPALRASYLRPQLAQQKASLRSELRPWLPSLEGCFEGAPRLPERLTLVVAVDAEGAVAGRVPASSEPVDPSLRGCVARTASRWHVAPREGALSVTYRLVRRLVADRSADSPVMLAAVAE